MGRPRLTVVVASSNAAVSVEACLTSLLEQTEGVELLVVDNSTDGTRQVLASRFPAVTTIEDSPRALIPELWRTGIERASGEIVAITTAHCVPARDWCSRILELHEVNRPAIGGAVENHPEGSLVDWAVYFCRYSAYMPPFPPGPVPEIPGDNASYRSDQLRRFPDTWKDGFWEPVFHAALKAAGMQLLLEPTVVVTHRRSFGFRGFLRGRFLHGLQFGSWRAARLRGFRRTAYLLLSPLIPVVLLLRTVRQVAAKRRHRVKLALSIPLLAAFFCAWAAGEAVGSLRGAGR